MDVSENDPAAAALAVLDQLGIAYTRYDHPPVFTVEQAVEHWRGIDAAHCKNLFLRNKKGEWSGQVVRWAQLGPTPP